VSDYKAVVTYEELRELTGYKHPGEVANCLTQNKVPYSAGKHGRPWTTVEALNSALDIRILQVQATYAEPEDEIEV
jgi:hypothetical protein